MTLGDQNTDNRLTQLRYTHASRHFLIATATRTQRVERRKVDGKTVREPIKDEFTLAAAGAKELSSATERGSRRNEQAAN